MEIKIINQSVVYADCDAIVNAANEKLKNGGGVCGAIFAAAGAYELQRECDAIGYCKTGHAVMTNGYNLKAKHIIHAVGPRDQNPYDLKHAFYNALVIADSNNLKSIGMVPISAGIFGFPINQCASIAIKVITSFKPKSLSEVRIYCYSQNEYQVFLQEYEKYLKANS